MSYIIWLKQGGVLKRFSIQQFVDRVPIKFPRLPIKKDNYGNIACSLDDCYSLLLKEGIALERDYSFRGSRRPREVVSDRVFERMPKEKVTGFVTLIHSTLKKIRSLLQGTPLTCCVQVTEEFNNYKDFNTVYIRPENMGSPGPETVYHSLIITGCGILDGVEYVEVRNNFGSRWGLHGKGKVALSSIHDVQCPIVPSPKVEELGRGKRKRKPLQGLEKTGGKRRAQAPLAQ
ncbi:hypothetical protein DM860_003577 [Cuscuta australis]|uniref:Peptidase C1A papain C-terminal domain-containing protein n=1 Tax=Cuscuta australis TaxID=267555 RepID=A0A328DJP5_9ASTE|nr:hypothetical protein DM860_003577 [Cuscuta australis]